MPAGNKGFAKYGRQNIALKTLGILFGFCTLAVLNKKVTAKRTAVILLPVLRKAQNVVCNFISTMQNPNIEFTRTSADKVFHTLISSDNELSQYFNDYIIETYGDNVTERLDYIDISYISRFIVDKFKTQQVDFFPTFFLQVDAILTSCDTHVDDLMVVGLFEGIQNIGGLTIDYYFGFDKWLLPASKSKWDTLIDNWEGQDWRNRNRQH